MAYPATIDSFTNPSGTQTLDNPDHALQHSNSNDAIEAIQAVLGTTAGTSVLKNFTAGQFAARNNNETFGSPTISGGTINNVVIGTPRITGGTVSGAVIGTTTITGGTASAFTISSGTLNSVTLGTPLIAAVTTAATTTPTSFMRAVVPVVGTLSDSPAGTITPNAASQQIIEVTFGTTAGNRTLGTPTNPTDGQSLTFRIKNNAAATGTLVWASVYRWSGGTAGTATMGTTASAWNYYAFRYNATDTKWDHQGEIKNLS
jgi:hypothetical protein